MIVTGVRARAVPPPSQPAVTDSTDHFVATGERLTVRVGTVRIRGQAGVSPRRFTEGWQRVWRTRAAELSNALSSEGRLDAAAPAGTLTLAPGAPSTLGERLAHAVIDHCTRRRP